MGLRKTKKAAARGGSAPGGGGGSLAGPYGTVTVRAVEMRNVVRGPAVLTISSR